MTKKVLVTGVTGNVGRYVAKELLRRGLRPKGAVSDPDAARKTVEEEIELVAFDFYKAETYEAAEQLSAALGKPIRYSNPSAGAFRKAMLVRGFSKEFVNVMAALYMTARFGMAKKVTNELEELLGRPGRCFRDYAADYATEFM